jgi:hypothetical protein
MDLTILKNELKTKALEIRQSKVELSKPHTTASALKQCQLHIMKSHIRLKHIAYCILRGTPYECIEKPREGNEPNMDIVQQFIQEIQHGQAKDVCACA